MPFDTGTLANPYEGSPPPPPGGAINPDAALPADVMEPPAFAATEQDVNRALDNPQPAAPAPALSWSWLGGAQTQAPQAPQAPQTPGAPQAPGAQGQQAPQAPLADTQQVNAIRRELAALPQYAQLSVAQLIQAGYDEAHATQLVNMATRAAESELNLALMQTITAPAQEMMVAEHIAQTHSVPGAQIDPRELVGERSPAAMAARARTLVETRRNAGVQARQVSRVDVVENSGGVSGATRGGRAETPFQMIRSGLQSQRSRFN